MPQTVNQHAGANAGQAWNTYAPEQQPALEACWEDVTCIEPVLANNQLANLQQEQHGTVPQANCVKT
jgi:hypothetical protein